MGWASHHISRLQAGETVSFRPRGHSMSGRIDSGQLVSVSPITDTSVLAINDIVLCSVAGKQFLHIIKAKRGNQFLISNNRGHINGWTSSIYGLVINIE